MGQESVDDKIDGKTKSASIRFYDETMIKQGIEYKIEVINYV